MSVDPGAIPSTRPGGRLLLVAMAGIACMAVSVVLPVPAIGVILLFAGAALLSVAVVYALAARRRAAVADPLIAAVCRLLEQDGSALLVTNAEGRVVHMNGAALRRFPSASGTRLVDALGDAVARPDDVIDRLMTRAEANDFAQEDLLVRRGHLRLALYRVGEDRSIWRFEDLADGPGVTGADAIGLPMLLLGANGQVVHKNEALRRFLGRRERALDRIFADLPIRPGEVHRIHTAHGERRARVIEIAGAAGRRELYLVPAGDEAASDEWDLVDALPVPLLKLSRDGTVHRANRLAKELLRLETDEHPAFSHLVEGLGRPLADWLAEAAEGRGHIRQEFLRASRAPQDLYIQVMLSRYEEGGEVSVIAVLNDATELKTLEAQFVQSQKMQAIGQLAGGVAHDFNNLLTAITGHCDLLLLKRDPGDPDFADLEQINQNANRAAALVSQLLAFSRKQNLRPELLDLRDMMGEVTHLLNRLVGEKITLTLNHASDGKRIRADRRQFEQVIVNLVVNARDAMPEGGRIAIETRAITRTEELARDRAVMPPGEYVMIRVSDQGSGIPHDVLPKIFEPFFTTKKAGEGTGLGLSTVYGIVKQSGGFIFADSAPEGGTTFSLYFPAHDAPPPEAEVAPQEHRPKLTPGKGVVLLVEDEAPVRAFASRALRLRGYTVLEAGSAEEALDKLEDPDLRVDVFVTDVIMPGMDGPSWVAKALESRPGTRVVFVSGYAEESIAEGQSRIPGSVFLPKPFSLAQLTETVQAQFR